MPTLKPSIKKTKTTAINESKSPYLVVTTPVKHREQLVKRVKLLKSVRDTHIHPTHPKSRGIIREIRQSSKQSTLSAQAESSIYRDDLAERIPRQEVSDHVSFIKNVTNSVSPAGSFRRGATECNDIDIVVLEPIDMIITKLISLGYIKHTFSNGAHKFSGIVKHPAYPRFRHLDMVLTSTFAYPFTMLYFTGSKRFNIIMRLKAKKLGFTLNEYGLFRDGVPVPGLNTEHDIFAALGMEYKEPRDRV